MIHDFEAWAVDHAETNSFSELKDTVLAIEASFYLDRLFRLAPYKEPLLSALGGHPFAIRAHIRNDLDILHTHGIKPLFVFDGLDTGKPYRPFKHHDDAARLNSEAWDLYNQQHADKAVDTFGNSGFAKPQDCYRLLQTILYESKIPFQVAPYSAHGQIAYLHSQSEQFVDAIAGSSDLLLFDVDRVIIELDFEHLQFTWVKRQAWINELGLLSPDQFVDACMLSGTEFLEPIPILTESHSNRKVAHLPQILSLMKIPGKNGIAVCKQAEEEPAMKRSDYLDRYRRRRMAIKHHVVLTAQGKVEPFAAEDIPNNLHEVIGQRLPEELYYYLSIGAIGPRALNQLTSAQIYEVAPVDGGDSQDYRTLVSERLTPIRESILGLLSYSLHRVYQHREIKLSCWFDPAHETTIRTNDLSNPANIINNWNIHDAKFLSPELENPSIASCIIALGDESIAKRTITKKTNEPLASTSDIEANMLFRFLHLRGYISNDHTLTSWGQVLHRMLQSIPPFSSKEDVPNGDTTTSHNTREAEEAALTSVELLRLGLLTSKNMFPTYSGAPLRGTAEDKPKTLLLSRIACLGRLKHKNIGFTGPLSRNLLGYSSMISVLRENLRELASMCFATLLLNGDADRNKPANFFTEIGLNLPFSESLDCSLGIAMKHYLDDLAILPTQAEGGVDETALSKKKEEVRKRGPKEWFPHAEDFAGDLERGFGIWDFCLRGVKEAGGLGLVSNEAVAEWGDCEDWLSWRR